MTFWSTFMLNLKEPSYRSKVTNQVEVEVFEWPSYIKNDFLSPTGKLSWDTRSNRMPERVFVSAFLSYRLLWRWQEKHCRPCIPDKESMVNHWTICFWKGYHSWAWFDHDALAHKWRNDFHSGGPNFLKSKMASKRRPSHLRDAAGGCLRGMCPPQK